jgi:hypothetical protein
MSFATKSFGNRENYQKMPDKIINYILTSIEIGDYKLTPDLSFPLKINAQLNSASMILFLIASHQSILIDSLSIFA